MIFIPFTISSAAAVPIIDWNSFVYNTSDGGIILSGNIKPTLITVQDDDLKNNGVVDSIIISISSDGDGFPTNIEMNLLETPSDNGMFQNQNLIFMSSNAIFSKGDRIIITLDKSVDQNGNPTQHVINPLVNIYTKFEVRSSTDPSGLSLTLIETNGNSGIFTADMLLGDLTDFTTNTLATTPGDVITFADLDFPTLLTNGLVHDPSEKTIGAIVATKNSANIVSIEATYVGLSATVSKQVFVSNDHVPGSGGGGLVRPSLVVDSSQSIVVSPDDPNENTGSGCDGDCIPPTLGIDQSNRRIVDNGFSYNDNPVDVELYYTPYPLITANVGQENLTVLKIYDNGGTQNIAHVGLGFGLGKGESFNDSKATINLDIEQDGTETTSVYDPENALDNVKTVTAKEPCSTASQIQCLVVFIYHTFREPLNFNMVATYVWDFDKNAWQNYYNHGVEIVGESLNPPKTELVAFGTKEMRGLYELERVDKKKDIWQDNYGNLYQHQGNDRFDLIYKAPKDIVYDKTTMHGCDRHCNWFEPYKLNEQMRAKLTLEEKILQGKVIDGEPLAEPFSYEYGKILQRYEDPELQNAIIHEQKRALALYDKLFVNHIHP